MDDMNWLAVAPEIVLLVADGLGGLPFSPGGKTELETALTPHLDACARANAQELVSAPLGGRRPEPAAHRRERVGQPAAAQASGHCCRQG
mgnify:CR=1 FL=1